ncbi:hypothetical protein [Algoriphagus sp.]|uniref:hypothetical protein n=1 Tax=Algoriphagus sp. TaxID=1872435 RepID=UPI003F730BEA
MKLKYKIILGSIILVVLGLLSYSDNNSQPLTSNTPAFSEGMDQKIKDAFLEVWQHYPSLHSYDFEVIQMQLDASTMQARPVIDLGDVFSNKRQYRLNVGLKVLDSGDLTLAGLPKNVLKGWFAHELGHIVDYENHSNLGMVTYGIRYSLSDRYKRDREHTADSIAIRHGFRDEIVTTKKYLMENDFISPTYQSQLKKYYMSIRGAELCPDKRVPILPEVDL